MTIRPSVPEVITVNSEILQEKIRDILPSQAGFGSELQASNVITPIIDLTAAAEGSTLPFELQEALAFGSQTAFDINNGTAALANSTGFWRIVGSVSVQKQSGVVHSGTFTMTDGLSSKTVWGLSCQNNTNGSSSESFDLIVFLAAGESISAVATANTRMIGSYRQVATGDGTLVNPNGYPL